MKPSEILAGVIFIALFMVVSAGAEPLKPPVSFETTKFNLLTTEGENFLQIPGGGSVKIPKHWLFPPKEEMEEEKRYTNPYKYETVINSFSIGNNLTGLHLSSYDLMPSGSANAGSGRDLFLIFDPHNKSLREGGFQLGITKSRVRSMGCFSAKHNNLVIGDVDGDGLTDIGVTREEIWCDSGENEDLSGPFYRKNKIRWYVFDNSKWRYSPEHDGKIPNKNFAQLPLIGLVKTPVQFVREILKDRIIEKQDDPNERTGMKKNKPHDTDSCEILITAGKNYVAGDDLTIRLDLRGHKHFANVAGTSVMYEYTMTRKGKAISQSYSHTTFDPVWYLEGIAHGYIYSVEMLPENQAIPGKTKNSEPQWKLILKKGNPRKLSYDEGTDIASNKIEAARKTCGCPESTTTGLYFTSEGSIKISLSKSTAGKTQCGFIYGIYTERILCFKD